MQPLHGLLPAAVRDEGVELRDAVPERAAGASVRTLVILYSINVFITFTLSQAGDRKSVV
jgi:hypothetical protein